MSCDEPLPPLAPALGGPHRPFAIGMRPVGADAWIVPGDDLAATLAEKTALFAGARDAVFRAEAGSEGAQGELWRLLAAHLTGRFPEVWRRDGDAVVGPGASGDASVEAPLLAAARVVADDLVLMMRGAGGWRLAAGAVCFPSHWRLADKAGLVFADVHAPVPGFGPGSAGAAQVATIFDRMPPGRVAERGNWSVAGTGALHLPPGTRESDAVWLRAERQTLRKLPESGAVVFTIRVSTLPVEALPGRADGRAVAARLLAQLTAMSAAERGYKGWVGERLAAVRGALAEVAEVAAGRSTLLVANGTSPGSID